MAKPGLSTEKASQKPGRETGKQHGLASPRRPFLDLRWGGLQCQTSRPEPIKKEGFAAEGFNLHLAVASVSNVASRTKKKAGFAAEGFNLHLALASRCTSHWLRDASWVAFGHVWASHPAKPGLSTEKASQKPGRETGKQHGLASRRRPFLDLRWGGLQCQTSRPEPIKKEGFAAEGFNLHLALASRCTSHWLRDASWVAFGHVWASHPAKPGLSTEKASQKPGRETGKQHGLASPRRPFLHLRWGGLQCQTLRPEPIKKEGFAAEGFNLHLLQCQTSRPEPIKKEGFAAEGFNLHLALASRCTSHWLRDASWVAFGHVWASHPAKPGLSTEKASQKPGRETGKQHGLASPRRPFLGLRWGGLQCQTLRPEPIKKEGFAAEGFNLHLAVAKPGLSTEKASQKPGRETGKQHGLASPRRPFLDLRWGGLQCQTLRPEPIKKRGFCSWGLQFAPRSGKTRTQHRKSFPEAGPRNRETAWPGEPKETVFGPALGWSSVSNVASRTYKKRGFCSWGLQFAPRSGFSVKRCVQNQKKRGFCSWGLQFAPRIGFEMHLALASRCILSGVWARLSVTPGKTRTQHRKSFPEAGPRNRETAWPGEPKETVFGPALGWSSVSNVASRTYKKRRFCSWGLQFAPRSGKTRTQHRKSFPEAGPRNRETAWPGEPKETVFGPALGWSSVSNVASRTYKKRGFCSWGLQFAPRSGKTRTQHRKSFPEAGPRNRETAWPGEPKETVFGPALGWSSVSNVASRTYKKKRVLQLRASICTSQWQNQDSAPKKLPRSRAAKQGNSMAWRAQGDRFWTCVGVVFSVKRRVQNL